MIINIAKEYTKTPGGRYIKEGPFSGEDFRIRVLKPAFEKSLALSEDLTVVLDGGYGYTPSFLEESFGGLVRDTNNEKVANIKIISEEEPGQVKKIATYIADELRKRK